MNETKVDLRARAQRVRGHVLRLAARGGCFVGASLSSTDLMVHLYSRVLRVTPETMADPARDVFLLSKGHDAPALYGTLVECGFLPEARLARHLSPSDSLYWHPNTAVPGVEFHSGSLGHLLSVGIGIALDARLRQSGSRVFVMLGDGELNEGSVWEACLVAAAHRLDNLVAIVDRNGFQANARTEDLIPLEPLGAKFEAFGWTCAGVTATTSRRSTPRSRRSRHARDGRPPSSRARGAAAACRGWRTAPKGGSCGSRRRRRRRWSPSSTRR